MNSGRLIQDIYNLVKINGAEQTARNIFLPVEQRDSHCIVKCHSVSPAAKLSVTCVCPVENRRCM